MDASEGGMKQCSTCKKWKPRSEFHRQRAKPDGLQPRCRDCNIAQALAAYRADPERIRARIYERTDRLREENRRRMVEYLLDHPCVDCGETDPVVLEFDHLRDKSVNVSVLAHRAVAFERVLAEIEKCEVVCANCHRRRTCTRLNSYRVRMLEEIRAARKSA